MIWIACVIFGFLVLRLMVSLSNLFTRQWLGSLPYSGTDGSLTGQREPGQPVSDNDGSTPLISVLIPARNEERNIGRLLNDLLSQEYANLEILVYDDLSEDNTSDLVNEFVRKDNRVRVIEGSPLPAGWLGKNNACHRLAMTAKGDYLLFLDADVSLKPQLISKSMSHANHYRLDLLSLFPMQEMKTFGEKITVPVMNWVLVGLLPLVLTRLSSWTSFSAANGQFMLFRAGVYRHYRFHEEHKAALAEDIEIFRFMKKKKLRTHTVLGNTHITCRMYGSWKEAIEGFSKNVLEYFGGHTIFAVLFALVTTFGFIPVFLGLPGMPFLLFLGLMTLNRIIISYLSRQPVLRNLLYAPFQQVALCIMIIKAFINKHEHTLIWKGRIIYEH